MSEESQANDVESLVPVLPPLTRREVTYKRLSSAAMSLVACVVFQASFNIAYSETKASQLTIPKKDHKNHTNTTTVDNSTEKIIVGLRCDSMIIDDELLAEQRYRIIVFTIASLMVCIGGLAIMPVLIKQCTQKRHNQTWEIYWKHHMKFYANWEFLWHSLLLLATYSSIPYSFCGDSESHSSFYKNHIFLMVNIFTCSQEELQDQQFCAIGKNKWNMAMQISNYLAGALSVWFSVSTIKHAWFPNCVLCPDRTPCGDLIRYIARTISKRFDDRKRRKRNKKIREEEEAGAASMLQLATSSSGDQRSRKSKRRIRNINKSSSASAVYNPYSSKRTPTYRPHYPSGDN